MKTFTSIIVTSASAITVSLIASLSNPPAFALDNSGPVRGSFGSGQTGVLSWEVRANSGGCGHAGKPGTWCDESNRADILADMAIEPFMESFIRSPKTKFVAISYYAFGSTRIADAICEETSRRELKVEAILQDWPEPRGPGSDGYRKLIDCANSSPNLRVTKLGGEGGIHHAKIFLAAESPDPFDISAPQPEAGMVVTVSSANLSHNGVGMHLENWLILNGPASARVMRGNWCYVKSLPALSTGRGDFHSINSSCLTNAASAADELDLPEDGIQFIPMPATRPARKAIDFLLDQVSSAKHSIKIAAHIFTAARTSRSGLVYELIAAARRGIEVTILLDDDTEMVYRRLGNWQRLKVGGDDIEAVQSLLSSPVKIRSVDTNEKTGQLHHNKFVIFDDETLWTGSGNFTASSLSGRNTEQFYVIKDAEIVNSYSTIWRLLHDSATPFGTLVTN
jgi:hypothetical protein